MDNESEVEGTPMMGPLPLELQQIRAQTASTLNPAKPATRYSLLDIMICNRYQGPLFLKFNTNLNFGEQLIQRKTIFQIGGYII